MLIMKKKLMFSCFFLLICVLASCEKDPIFKPIPPLSDVPKITLKNVAPTAVRQFADSIVFTIEYEDGNGDVGWDVADSVSVFITDNRVPLTEQFFIPNVAPMTSNIAVRGQFKVVLPHTIIINPASASEYVTFSIRLKDRAGNSSNTVTTQQMTVSI
jgi:hypothetical protein